MRTRCVWRAPWRLSSLLLPLLLVLAPCAQVSVARASEPVHVRLRGAARIDAQGVRGDGGDLVVRGVLSDDAGAPLAEGALTLSIARASAPSIPLGLANDALGARSCETDGRAGRVFTDGIHLVADGAGRFCVRVPLAVGRYVAHLAYAGAGYVDPGATDVEVDLSKRTCALAFSSPPRVVLLDAKSVTLDAIATLEGDGTAAAAVGFPLTLSSEHGASEAGTTVATATTDLTGHARFTFVPSPLGAPGRGELRLGFAGNKDAAPAVRVAQVERHAEVALDVPEAQSGKLPPSSPEDGVSLAVTARAVGGEVTSGSVEARVGDAIVGAAPIEAGSAKLFLAFGLPESAGASGEVAVTLRYVPSAPWYEPGNESSWKLPLRARSPLRQAWVLLGALAVAVWFALSRVERARSLAKPLPRPRASPHGEAKLDLIRVAPNAADGWRGRVTDADDATPVAGARVQVERPAFGRAEVFGSVLTDDDGRFELGAYETRPGDELAIEAPLHLPLRRALPRAGELDAQLIQRKRALLGRLVVWAKLRGRPFDARPEPTPGHVRRAAGGDFRIARWADAVERAAFAGEPVDAHVEAEVDRLAPGANAPPPEPHPPADRRALAHPTKANR